MNKFYTAANMTLIIAGNIENQDKILEQIEALFGDIPTGSILIDEDTGAVVYTDKTAKESFDAIQGICPYNVPRQDKKMKVISKCDMCNDRVKAGKRPACVTSCPTGTMNFGDRDEMLKLAESARRGQEEHLKAQLVDADSVRVIFLTADDPTLYSSTLDGRRPPRRPTATPARSSLPGCCGR